MEDFVAYIIKNLVSKPEEVVVSSSKIRLTLMICVIIIFALGLMMVFNTSSAEILDRSLNQSTHYALIRQILYALIGLLGALLVSKIGYEQILRFAPFFLVGISLLLLLVYVPGIGKVRNGAHRWIGFGGFTFQPSEFAKYLIPMTYIDWILKKEGQQIPFYQFCKIVATLAIPMALILIEPDNGTTAVIAASLIPLFFLSHIRFKFWALPMLLFLVVGVVAAYQLPYVRGRIQVYLHPELDIKGKGHQPHQAKIAAGSGGFIGRGAGSSLQKLTYLPEAQNDYIAAIFAEEFGFLGIVLLILLYMVIAYAGFLLALQSHSLAGNYLASSITFIITLQAFLNLAVVSGLLPSKGVNLPFFSQGGTSLIANILGLAILLTLGKNEENYSQRRGNRRTSLPGSKSCQTTAP